MVDLENWSRIVGMGGGAAWIGIPTINTLAAPEMATATVGYGPIPEVPAIATSQTVTWMVMMLVGLPVIHRAFGDAYGRSGTVGTVGTALTGAGLGTAALGSGLAEFVADSPTAAAPERYLVVTAVGIALLLVGGAILGYALETAEVDVTPAPRYLLAAPVVAVVGVAGTAVVGHPLPFVAGICWPFGGGLVGLHVGVD